MQQADDDRVPPLDLQISQRMADAAQALVRNKFQIDLCASDRGAVLLAGDLHGGGQGPHTGDCFLQFVIPFYRLGDRTDNYVLASVPTAHTLGCSWRWQRRNLDDAEASRRVEQLTDTDALVDGSIDCVRYTWIKPLGLIAPGEGKNRVDFFRHEGIESIPAKVYERDYPAPDRLAIYEVEKEGFKETWAVLDGRWVEKVEYPHWAVPLLSAYGVPVKARWPREFPAPEKVKLGFFDHPGSLSPMGHPELRGDLIVDMETIKAIAQYQSEEMACTAWDLKHVKINPALLKCAGAGAVASLVCLGAAPDSWVDFRIMAGIVFGACFSAGALPYIAPMLTTQRRNVDRQLPIAVEQSPKYEAMTGKRHLG